MTTNQVGQMTVADACNYDPEILVAHITAAGATQNHVARILNVSEATVSRWADGTRQPSDYTLRRLQRLHRDVTAWDAPTTTTVAS